MCSRGPEHSPGAPGWAAPIPQETEIHSFYLHYYKHGILAGAQWEKRFNIGRRFTGRPTNKQGKKVEFKHEMKEVTYKVL